MGIFGVVFGFILGAITVGGIYFAINERKFRLMLKISNAIRLRFDEKRIQELRADKQTKERKEKLEKDQRVERAKRALRKRLQFIEQDKDNMTKGRKGLIHANLIRGSKEFTATYEIVYLGERTGEMIRVQLIGVQCDDEKIRNDLSRCRELLGDWVDMTDHDIAWIDNE